VSAQSQRAARHGECYGYVGIRDGGILERMLVEGRWRGSSTVGGGGERRRRIERKRWREQAEAGGGEAGGAAGGGMCI